MSISVLYFLVSLVVVVVVPISSPWFVSWPLGPRSHRLMNDYEGGDDGDNDGDDDGTASQQAQACEFLR